MFGKIMQKCCEDLKLRFEPLNRIYGSSTFHSLDIIPYFMFRKSQTWASVLEAARDNVIYVAAFTAQLENPATLPEHLKLAKDKQDATRLVLYCTAKVHILPSTQASQRHKDEATRPVFTMRPRAGNCKA